MTRTTKVVGIDVSKGTLDAYLLPLEQERQFANTPAGHGELVDWLVASGVELAAMEASGGYEKAAGKHLREAGLEVEIVDPKRVRYFAKAQGEWAKTDRIDARIIAEFAARPRRKKRTAIVDDPAREALSELVGIRQGLIDHRIALAQQAEAASPGSAQRGLLRIVKAIAREIEAIDQRIAAAIAGNARMAELARRLNTVPGLGPGSIAALIAWLPELGQLNRKQIAALVGLAPFPDDSGSRKGVRFIQGGRTKLRNILYMAIVAAATRHNPLLKATYTRLVDRGKPAKVALVACMRKLLTIINAMVAHQQDWRAAETTA